MRSGISNLRVVTVHAAPATVQAAAAGSGPAHAALDAIRTLGVDADWDLRVEPGGEDGIALLSSRVRFLTGDDIPAAWGTISAAADALARRALAIVKASAEECEPGCARRLRALAAA
jgi:hypothetical protein